MTWSGERPIRAPACGRFNRKVFSTKSVVGGMSCSTASVCSFCMLISRHDNYTLYFTFFCHKLPSPQPPRHHAVQSILVTLYVKYTTIRAP